MKRLGLVNGKETSLRGIVYEEAGFLCLLYDYSVLRSLYFGSKGSC